MIAAPTTTDSAAGVRTGVGDGPRWPAFIFLLTGAAIVLRLLLLLGRGDYIAFDEGWYLLLARSLFTGDGYSLVGIPHTTLSPLFPILTGALGAIVNDWVWAGRIVAAVASGLVVLPAWSIFRRLERQRTALIAVSLAAVMPSLAPFVVPFWIGADLWVGAEPMLHLFLYTGVAAWLWADERGGWARWGTTGAAFALAFLARPEGIITWGLLGLAAIFYAVRRRSSARLVGATVMGLAFLVVAFPYWSYLHDVTGRWSLTGRSIAPAAATAQLAGGPDRAESPTSIERMLWGDDPAYERMLYSLDDTGLRLRNRYWGIYVDDPVDPARPPAQTPPAREATPSPGADGEPEQATGGAEAAGGPSSLSLFIHSMGLILPLLLWPFVILGLARPREPGVLRRELPVAGALFGTSLAIAALVAIDPRTQLFLVPLLAFYAARGFALVEEVIRARLEHAPLRPGFLEAILAGAAVVWLLGINGQRLYRSVVYGSPHHVVAEQNRAVGEELDGLLESEGPVASWHPAIAVYADRDWRVLPFADLPSIIRYEQAAGAVGLVLSAYYPPDLRVEDLDTRYLVLDVPPPDEAAGTDPALRGWNIRIVQRNDLRALGAPEPAPAP